MIEQTATQAEASLVPPAAPLTQIQQSDAEIARLRELRFNNSAQSKQYHDEIIAISHRLREPGVPLDEVERLQARRGSLSQVNTVAGVEEERLEREVRLAADVREALLQERRGYEHVKMQLRREIFDQRAREQMLLREAQQAALFAEQADTQLRNVEARIAQLGEVPLGSR